MIYSKHSLFKNKTMTDVRNLETQFSEIEEGIIKNFTDSLKPDKVEREKSSTGSEIILVYIGITEVEISIQIEDEARILLVCGKNISKGSHYIGNPIKTPVGLVKELSQFKTRLR